MESESERIKYLIADTTAFINNVNLHEYAENVLTVPDVVNEVKNKRQIRRLVVLPFDLCVREPREDHVAHVINFAKQTGDYRSLSMIDLKVIALTYELHVEHEGTKNLRSEPVISTIIMSKEKPDIFIDNTKLAGFYEPTGNDDASDEEDEPDLSNEETNDIESSTSKGHLEEKEFESKDESKSNLEKDVDSGKDNSDIEDEDDEGDEIDFDLEDEIHKLKIDDKLDEILPKETNDDENSEDENSNEEQEEGEENEEDEDDSGWITPSNIKKIKKEMKGKVLEDIPIVACMTTDYALQNVLKQINLNITALDGRVIKQLRTYILRCYACFKTTSILTKLFCPNCGNKTLKRVAVSLDENGKQVIHINTKRPLTRKYKNQSLPRPKGGKHSTNPLVVEDQPMPKQMPSRVAKTKTQALEEDYVAGYSAFAKRDLNSKSALLRAKGHLKEWARNNQFEEERRKKYFNRLIK